MDGREDGERERLGAAPAQTEILGAARVGTVLAPPHHFCPLWPVIGARRALDLVQAQSSEVGLLMK